MSRVRLFLPLLVFVVMAALLWRGLSLDPNYMPSALENRPLPVFAARTLDGREVSEQDLVCAIALINVWATWCPTCHVEHAYLNRLAAAGVVIYGVNYKDDPQEARRWLEQKGDPYRFNIADESGRLGLDLGATGAPETYLIDAAGVVRLRYQGAMDERVWNATFLPVIESLTGSDDT
jgi:cytochrome c biogenesis protein CcmG, thiol:disulfide interchange protein DsbE